MDNILIFPFELYTFQRRQFHGDSVKTCYAQCSAQSIIALMSLQFQESEVEIRMAFSLYQFNKIFLLLIFAHALSNSPAGVTISRCKYSL